MQPSTTTSAALPRAAGIRFVARLGQHHYAHLRAVAEGLPIVDAAKRYLAVSHGHQAHTAHWQTVDAVRAVARRRHEPAWRLIGLTITVSKPSEIPTLEQYIEDKGYQDWREDEVLAFYQDEYGEQLAHSGALPKARRRERTRAQVQQLLGRLQVLECQLPHPHDSVAGWFDSHTAQRLITAGFNTLGELRDQISRGGRWYRTLPAIGQAKAERIASFLETLLGKIESPALSSCPVFSLASLGRSAPDLTGTAPLPALGSPVLVDDARAGIPYRPHPAEVGFPVLHGQPPSPPLPALVDARNDAEIINAWVDARAGSDATVKCYRREAARLMLWLKHERHNKGLDQMSVEDCRDYMAFLQNIPSQWISRNRAAPGETGWAPFRGQLSHKSRQQAFTIIVAFFTWANAARYLNGNPWMLVNLNTGDDPDTVPVDSRSLSEAAMSEVLRFIRGQAPSPSRDRIAFLLVFLEATGLRSSEIIKVQLKDFMLDHKGRWSLRVMGKGSKLRTVALSGQAIHAVDTYLQQRGVGSLQTASGELPLLASTKNPTEPIGYQALYEHVRGWLSKAIGQSALPFAERQKLSNASTHWLRHTYGTRAVARDVPLDVLQAQMGHASFETSASIYGKAPMDRRFLAMEHAFPSPDRLQDPS